MPQGSSAVRPTNGLYLLPFTVGPPARCSSLLGPDRPPSLPVPSFFCFSMSLSFIVYQFHISFLLFRPFFLFFCATQTLLSCPSLLRSSTNRLHPPLWISVFPNCSPLLTPLDFPLSFSPHYYVPWSSGPAWHLPPPLFFLFHFAVYYHFLYLFFTYLFFVLVLYLLSSPPFTPLQSGVSWFCTQYFYHADTQGLTSLLPLLCFRLSVY